MNAERSWFDFLSMNLQRKNRSLVENEDYIVPCKADYHEGTKYPHTRAGRITTGFVERNPEAASSGPAAREENKLF
jgi:hypothetical protein